MRTPKPIHQESIPRALAKAERYRLLNEPSQAESICRDVLAIDAANQQALICLILAMTDMFAGAQVKVDEVRPLVQKLSGRFDRVYYAGVVEERWARSLLLAGYPRPMGHELLLLAMDCFEQAQPLAETGNDDAILRWNACLRFMDQIHLDDTADDHDPPSLDDDVPVR